MEISFGSCWSILMQPMNILPNGKSSVSSPRPTKARQVCSNVRRLFMVDFDVLGIVHQDFVPQLQTVSHFYKGVLRWKRNEKSLFPRHDDAPSDSAIYLQEFQARKRMTFAPTPQIRPRVIFCFQNQKWRSRREDIWWHHRNQRRTTDCTHGAQHTRLPTMAESLGSICQAVRTSFARGIVQ
jgi:hypothetical protein